MATDRLLRTGVRQAKGAAWRVRARSLLLDAAVLGVLIGLYTILLARGFLSRQYYFAGDNFSALTIQSEVFASLRHSHSLPWWDPTLSDGVPIYAYDTIINPFVNFATLPMLTAFVVVDRLVHVPIAAALAFEGSVFVFSLTLLAFYLAARELTRRRLAAAFPALVFSFCYIQAMNFKDGYLYPAVGALFYVYGLVRYSRRRTLLDLSWLVFFAAFMASTASGEFMQSAFFWVCALTATLAVLSPDLFGDTWRLLRQAWTRPLGRTVIIALAVLLTSGILATYVPFHVCADRMLRYRGGAVEYGQRLSISTGAIPIEDSRSWTVLLNWLPFREVQDAGLLPALIGGAHDYRYLGVAMIPPLLACFLLGGADVWAWALLAAYFFCDVFLIYTTRNLAYQALLDHWALLRSVRNMSTMMPRGGPSLFLVLLSGIGLDRILRREKNAAGLPVYEQALKALLVLGCLLLIGIPLLTGPLRPLMNTAAHVGLYLTASTLVCWALLRAESAAWQRRLCAVLFVFAFMDLTISLSSRIDLINEEAPYPHVRNEQVRVPASIARFPDDPELKPSNAESQDLFPPDAVMPGGFHHTVYDALKDWLVLYSHDAGRRFLKTYDFATNIQTRYPHFEFFTNGYYVPMDRLAGIDHDKEISGRSPAFFLHEPDLVSRSGAAPRAISGKYDLTEFSFNEVDLKTETARPGFLYYLDAYDPYWRAYVDGSRTAVHRANFAFKAIELPAGSHSVSWIYDPWPVKAALYSFWAIAALGLLLLLGWEALTFRVPDEP